MSTQQATARSVEASFSPRSKTLLVAAAVGFVALYLSTDFVAPSLASSSLPLPTDPVSDTRDWFATNQLAAVVVGVCQFLSVSCLALFITALSSAVTTQQQLAGAAKARPWGWLAVGLMMLSSALAWLLAVWATSASLDTVSVLRTASFITGGTAHVLALGLFVLLAARIRGMSKPVRVLGYVAAVPAVLSVFSLVVFEASAFILLGRLLCMIWTVSAAVGLARRGRGTSDE